MGVNPGTRREGHDVSVSFKTPIVLPISKSGKTIVADRGKREKYTLQGKDPVPIEKQIFRNVQPVPDDDRIFFVAMTSTSEQGSFV